jgi:uncharacterized protein YcaQ
MLIRRSVKPKSFSLIENPEKLIEEVLKLIEQNGEITTSDVILDNSNFKSRWSGMNKRILDYLALRGYIAVSRREKYSTVYYKLIDDVIRDIPQINELPDRMEVFWNEVTTNIEKLRLVPFHRLLHYTYSNSRFKYKNKTYTPRNLIKKAISKGDLEKISINGTDFIAKPGTTDQMSDIPTQSQKVFLLSPFDNALWSRESLKSQYGFDYKMEIYVPKNKRKYGYYAMPILYGERFVGRLDPKLDRSNQKMNFLGWYWENGFTPDEVFWDELCIRLEYFLDFHKCKSYSLGNL